MRFFTLLYIANNFYDVTKGFITPFYKVKHNYLYVDQYWLTDTFNMQCVLSKYRLYAGFIHTQWYYTYPFILHSEPLNYTNTHSCPQTESLGMWLCTDAVRVCQCDWCIMHIVTIGVGFSIEIDSPITCVRPSNVFRLHQGVLDTCTNCFQC